MSNLAESGHKGCVKYFINKTTKGVEAVVETSSQERKFETILWKTAEKWVDNKIQAYEINGSI